MSALRDVRQVTTRSASPRSQSPFAGSPPQGGGGGALSPSSSGSVPRIQSLAVDNLSRLPLALRQAQGEGFRRPYLSPLRERVRLVLRKASDLAFREPNARSHGGGLDSGLCGKAKRQKSRSQAHPHKGEAGGITAKLIDRIPNRPYPPPVPSRKTPACAPGLSGKGTAAFRAGDGLPLGDEPPRKGGDVTAPGRHLARCRTRPGQGNRRRARRPRLSPRTVRCRACGQRGCSTRTATTPDGRLEGRIDTLTMRDPPAARRLPSFSLTPVPLARDGCACAPESRRRPVGLAGSARSARGAKRRARLRAKE